MSLTYQEFKKKFKNTLFTLNNFDESLIKDNYCDFLDKFEESKKNAINTLRKKFGFDLPDDVIDQIRKANYQNEKEFNDVVEKSLDDYLKIVYKDSRLDCDNMCLVSNLIGMTCQMIDNDEMLGVIRDVDVDSKFLLIDFGEKDLVKVNPNKLIIAGQKMTNI